MINNGIISNGDHNINTIHYPTDYDKLTNDLKKLLGKTTEKDIVQEAITYAVKKDDTKLIKCLKKLKKSTCSLIQTLALTALQAYIEKYI